MQRRIPGTISGAPALDQAFAQIWWCLGVIQLWGFMVLITQMTVKAGAVATTFVFSLLLLLIVLAIGVGSNLLFQPKSDR